jgi:Ni/Co efflux regulator RcnB
MNTTSTSIHCKTTFNGQIRRFALTSTEFTSLKETITKLFSLNGEFVLKYKDDESDFVTLDTQDELLTALRICPSILRILVVSRDSSSESTTSSDDSQSKMHRRHHHERKDHRHKDRKDHCHKDRKEKSHCHKDRKDLKEKSQECRKERALKKLAYIDQCLADLGTDDSSPSPKTLYKKQKLIRKKEKIETWIKGDCYSQRKREGRVTPEEEQFNHSIKTQIFSVKVEAKKVRERQREIKMMLQEKEDKSLIEELSSLKEKKKLLKNQKRALIDQLHI